MLVSLVIRNVVLIEHLEVQFQDGFCALTGETGAGKSILLDSLGLALGGRSDAGLIRKGAEQASVTASFEISADHALYEWLRDRDLESDTTLVLRRVLGVDGRSRAFINDQPVSITVLRDAGAMLVEVHGQFETHGLLDAKTHRALLDEYAGLTNDVRALSRSWNDWRSLAAQRETAKIEAEKARSDEEYLRHAVSELETLAPQTAEEESLLIQRESLKHRAQILQALDESWQAISGDAGAELSTSRAARTLERIADRVDADLTPVIDALDRAESELQDAVSRLQSITATLEGGAQSAESLEDRLYALRGVARKHHCQADELPSLLDTLRTNLDAIVKSDDLLAALDHKVSVARQDYFKSAEKISATRINAAMRLDQAVAQELPPLKLDRAKFITSCVRAGDEGQWGPDGIDQVRFLVATNPGSEPGALGKIASGGEMARFMLAIKVVMAALGNAQSLIFDEVDSGIGGSTADAVGERLARLAKTKQILVVTHSPQVAARAAHHWIVMKGGVDDVRTTVVPLFEWSQRQEEIARMLSGASITSEARAAAQKLLDASLRDTGT